MNQPSVEIVRLDGSVEQCRILPQRLAATLAREEADGEKRDGSKEKALGRLAQGF